MLPLAFPGAQISFTGKEIAEHFYIFAIENGLMFLGDESLINKNIAQNQNIKDEIKKTFGRADILTLLKQRILTIISFDDKKNKILISTQKPIGVRVEKSLPDTIFGKFKISYHVSGVPEVKGLDSSSHVAEPYRMFKSFYSCGSSVFPANQSGAGTFGALVYDSLGELYGLSNNHVTGASNNCPAKMPILAPGSLDVGPNKIDPFTIGHHSSLLPIHDGHPTQVDVNQNLDVAIFKIADKTKVSSMQGGLYDTPTSLLNIDAGMRVEKVGRTTGHTVGRILGVCVNPFVVLYEAREYSSKKFVYFPGNLVWAVESSTEDPFSSPGDSGSLVVHKDDSGNYHAVGLVFAGNERTGASYILPISSVLSRLDCRLACGINAT